MSNFEIPDKRLISVLFNELVYLEHSLILFFSGSTGEVHSKIFRVDQIDNTDPRKPTLNVGDEKYSGHEVLGVEFILNGKRFLGELKSADTNGNFFLPELLRIEDRRAEERHAFRSDRGCEILLNGNIYLGIPIDLSSRFFVCQVTARTAELIELEKGREATAIIYGNSELPSVTFPKAKVSAIRNVLTSDAHIVFELKDSLRAAKARKSRNAKRKTFSDLGSQPFVTLSTRDQVSPASEIMGKVTSVSLTGFAVSPAETSKEPLKGVQYFSPEVQANFKYVRKVAENEYAFTCSDFGGDRVTPWVSFVEKHTDLLSVATVDPERIGKFLIECGFIKGKRREYFGDSPAHFIVDQWLNDKNLFRRYVELENSGQVGGQCSAVRISNGSWLIQEAGAGIFKQSDFRALLSKTMAQMVSEREIGILDISFFGTIYDQSLRPPVEYWRNSISKDGRFYECAHLSLGDEVSADTIASDSKTISLEEITRGYPEQIVRCFGLAELVLNVSDVDKRLHRLSNAYGIHCKYLQLKGGGTVCLYYYRGPYTLNVSGLVNSVFLIFSGEITNQNLHETISFIRQNEEFSGTRDILTISGTNKFSSETAINFDRRFWLAVDKIDSYMDKMRESVDVA